MKGLIFIWKFVRVYWIRVTIVLFFILLSTYLQVVSPKILGDVFAKLVTYVTEFTSGTATETTINDAYSTFITALIYLFLIYLATLVVMIIQNVVMTIITGKATNDMRIGLFKKIENLSVRFFDKSNDGELISRFTNDIDNISNALNQGIVQVVSNVALLIGYSIMMFQDSVTFATLIVGIGLLALFISQFILIRARSAINEQQETLGELNGYITERVSGQMEIIAYGIEDETIENFDTLNEKYRKSSTRGQLYSGLLFPVIQGLGIFTTAAFIFLGGLAVINGNLEIAIFIAFVQYAQRFFMPLNNISSQYNIMQLAITGAGRVAEIFGVKKEVVNTEEAHPISGIEGKVEIKNVNFSYDENKPVLKDINIEVVKGQMVALVGPTGSGKTTVMNLMNRFYDVNSGEILFDGENIRNFEIQTLRKNVGIVLQESVLFSGTIIENIAYGKDDATMEEVTHAAEMANIHEFIMTLPDQYETYVTDSSSIFSTGQKQLMSIARTILTDPDLLILDEATSNVDTVTEAKIQKAMNNVLHGRTSFVIAHRLKTILDADKIIVLKDGEIIESGSHEQLIAENGFYSELYFNQFVIEEE